MTASDFYKQTNNKLSELNLKDSMMPGVDNVFKANNDVAGLLWLNGDNITGMTLNIIPRDIKLFSVSYLIYALAIDILTGISEDRRNVILKEIGLSDGTWLRGKTTNRKGVKYKAYRRKDTIRLEIILNGAS